MMVIAHHVAPAQEVSLHPPHGTCSGSLVKISSALEFLIYVSTNLSKRVRPGVEFVTEELAVTMLFANMIDPVYRVCYRRASCDYVVCQYDRPSVEFVTEVLAVTMLFANMIDPV